MSQIYLTKIERKTIFTKSLIFVLVMFIISDLTVTGPFWFNFIPWLYILGIVSSVKKIDGALVCLIGSFTVFVASLITAGTFNASCMLATISALVQFVLGIITGRCIFEFILEHRLVKYIKHSKKVMLIVSMLAMLITSFIIVGLEKGNLITYLKSKSRLNEYITNTYGTSEYEITKTKYSFKVPGKYVYIVNMDGQDVYFVPSTKITFKDSNMNARLESINKKVDSKLKEKVSDIIQENNLAISLKKITFNMEYSKVLVNPDRLAMYISCLATDDSLDTTYNNLAFIITKLEETEDFQKIVIELNGENLTIPEKDISNVTAEYIEGGFEIEELSDN